MCLSPKWLDPPPHPRCLWGLADTYPDSDPVGRSLLFSGGSSSDRADSLAYASGSGGVITIDAAIMGALDDAAFVASCGARISAAADADDVLGDDYDAGAYEALCRV